jgi:hypothetical protein
MTREDEISLSCGDEGSALPLFGGAVTMGALPQNLLFEWMDLPPLDALARARRARPQAGEVRRTRLAGWLNRHAVRPPADAN